MTTQRIALTLTLANLVLAAFLVSQAHPANASDVAPVLRGRSLEIVDERGRIRASIKVEPPTTVDSQDYPEAVVFRLRDGDDTAPGVKLDTSGEGAGMTLAGGKVRLMAKRGDNFVSVADVHGREQVLKP
jgi:hypothetical protein